MPAIRSLLALCAAALSVTVASGFIFDEDNFVDGCVTPDGFKGDCVNLLRCRPLAMLLRRPISAKAKDLLRKSVCGGLKNRVPDVCCPRSGAIRTTTEAPMIFFGGHVHQISCGFMNMMSMSVLQSTAKTYDNTKDDS